MNSLRLVVGLGAAVVSALVAACGDGATSCVPGEQVGCACPGGTEGAQVCLPSGEAYGVCVCDGGTGGGTTTSTTGTMGTGTGGEGSCVPGTIQSCYEGPANTEGVGICTAGERTCEPDAMGYGPCTGQVLPDAESCSTAADEDCDGQTPPCTDLWSHGFGIGSSFAGVQRVAVDAQGNVIVFGQLDGSQSLTGEPAQQYWKMFVAKFDATGDLVFALPIGEPLYLAYPGGLAVDEDGNIFIDGFFQTTLDIGTETISTNGEDGVFVAKISPNGDALWATAIEATVQESASDIAVFPNGDILLAGYFHGQIYFGGPQVLMTSNGSGYAVRLDTNGGFISAATYELATINDVATGPNGGFVLTGSYQAPVDFGGGPLPTDTGSGGAFFALFDAAGNHIQSAGFPWGGGNAPQFSRVAMDSTGAFAITGRTSVPVDFGGGPIEGMDVDRPFVVKFDAAGVYAWSHAFDFTGSYPPALVGVGISVSDEVLAGGVLRGSADFGGGVLEAPDSGEAAVLVRFDSAGAWVSDHAWGAGPMTSAAIVHVAGHPDGTAVFAGTYAGVSEAVDFGQGQLPTGGTGAFVAKEVP